MTHFKNTKNHLLTFAILFFFLAIGNSFSQTQQWVNRFNGVNNSDDVAEKMMIDNSGNVYITGYTTKPGDNTDFLVIKYNSSGVQQWAATYEGTSASTDKAVGIAIDNNGNVYITGTSVGAVNNDIVTIKYNSNGVQQWVQRYDGPASFSDEAVCIAVDPSGNVFAAGSSEGNGTNQDMVTIKYSSSGVIQWADRFNGSGNADDVVNAIVSDASGNVFITGVCRFTYNTFVVVKYNSSGNRQFLFSYSYNSGGDGCIGKSITADNNGNIYATGEAFTGSNRILTTKINSSGSTEWMTFTNAPINEYVYEIKVDANQNPVVAGENQNGALTIKYNSQGVIQWTRSYHGQYNNFSGNYVQSVSFDLNGNIYVSGISREGQDDYDYLTIRYSPAGIEQSVMKYNGPVSGYDRSSACCVDMNGNIFITGRSTGNNGFDACTIKYQQFTGISPISNEIPNEYNLSQNYPNPFNPSTKIRFSIPQSAEVKLTVFDITGKVVAELANGNFNAGTYEVDWNAAMLSSGTYFYRVSAGKFTETKKMILVK